MNKVALIVPVFNLSWMTVNMIHSLSETADITKFEIIILDNNSSEEEIEKVEEACKKYLLHYSIIKNKENLGFIKAVNIGIELVRGRGYDYFFILNNDIIFTSEWFERLLDTLKRDKVGIVGPMTSPPNWRELPSAKKIIEEKLPYRDFKDNMESYAQNLRVAFDKQEIDTDFVAFYCAGFKTELIRKIGKLNEKYYMGLFDDDDFCYRTLQAGYKIKVRRDTYVHHYHRSTWIENKMEYSKILEHNRSIFISEHGFNPWDRVKK